MVSSAITFISSQQRICLFSQPVHDVAFIFWLLWTKRKLVFIFVKLLLHRNFFKMQINDQIMRVWKSSCFCKAKLLQGCDNSKKGEKKYKSLFYKTNGHLSIIKGCSVFSADAFFWCKFCFVFLGHCQQSPLCELLYCQVFFLSCQDGSYSCNVLPCL